MISIIAAVAENGVIGDKNTLLWHISEDLRNFKRVTSGHPVVMGRNTFLSLGRPLPGRTNVVVSRTAARIEGCRVVRSLEEAFALFPADEEIFVPWDDTPVVLPNGSASLYLIKQVRDEAHRFAITFHRELRDKAMTVSVLDEVDGVGPTRKKAIMKHFGSMKRLRAASVEEIASVKGVPVQVAQAVYDTLRAWDEERRAAAGSTDAN